MFEGVLNIVVVLLILVGLVVIHEFGHFITARLAGVRVHEFGIGFPPRARIIGRDHETIYTLNWLPIGGFVRLEGEEGDSTDPRSFIRQRLPVRLTILLAGVVMNFLVAFLVFTFIAAFADPSVGVRIYNVPTDQGPSPAQTIGLVGGKPTGTNAQGQPTFDESGDVITAVDGQRFSWFDAPEGTPDRLLVYLRQHPGQTVTVTVKHADGRVEDRQVTLRSGEDAVKNGSLGIQVGGFPPGETISRDFVSSIGIGFGRTVEAGTQILRGLVDLVTNLARPQVSGPIGIVQAVGIIRTEFPPVFLLYLIGALSANLAIVNVLPFPPMDGGRIAVSLVQAVSGNRVSLAAERAVYFTGFVLLMALLAWISFHDIQRLGGGG